MNVTTTRESARRLGSLKVWMGLVAAVCAMGVTPAFADESGAPPKGRPGEITLRPVIIKERVPRPLAAVEISRVSAQQAIPLRAFSPFDRIEGATRRAPF